MNMVKYNANDLVPTSFSTLIDRLFNDKLSQAGTDFFVPKVDIAESEKAFELHLAAPGLTKKDFKIEISNSVITISGERKFAEEKKDRDFRSIETQYGTFSRSFTLPETVDSSKIEAKYNNGILELTIPKDEEKTMSKTISVN